MNVADHVDVEARINPNRLTPAAPSREMTYGERSAETAAVANGLAGLGVEPGDPVAQSVLISVTFAAVDSGAMKRGMIPVPVELRVCREEMEDVVYELDGVAKAAVVGTTHGRLGEQVTAGVRGNATAGGVRRVCRDRRAAYEMPRPVRFVDEFPTTATRKIDEVAPRDRYGA